jgi:hypothetical protein
MPLTIKSFTTALPGWRAVYYDETDKKFIVSPVVGWAVVTENGMDVIIPQVWDGCSTISDPAECVNFCGVLSPDEKVPDLNDEIGREWVSMVSKK